MLGQIKQGRKRKKAGGWVLQFERSGQGIVEVTITRATQLWQNMFLVKGTQNGGSEQESAKQVGNKKYGSNKECEGGGGGSWLPECPFITRTLSFGTCHTTLLGALSWTYTECDLRWEVPRWSHSGGLKSAFWREHQRDVSNRP